MKKLSDFSRISFGVMPTPLYKLENISRQFGKNIYIKRDDMIGVALGGNKVRKLEYLLADARDQGADVVLTAGGPQSNHAMLTAACASRIGMKAMISAAFPLVLCPLLCTSWRTSAASSARTSTSSGMI